MIAGAYYGGPDVLDRRAGRHGAGLASCGGCRAARTASSATSRRPSSASSTCRSSRRSWHCCSTTTTGVERVLTFIAVTIASDIGGYCAGVLFGKHPMAPVISPKKTWEGFAGLGDRLRRGRRRRAWCSCSTATGGSASCSGLVVVVAATLGDLAESLIKRDLGIKDMSNILPGPRRHHGPARLACWRRSRVVWLVLHFLL